MVGRGILATGVVTLFFHLSGTTDQDTDRLNSVLSGLDNIEAAIFKNQDGNPPILQRLALGGQAGGNSAFPRGMLGGGAVLFNVGAW